MSNKMLDFLGVVCYNDHKRSAMSTSLSGLQVRAAEAFEPISYPPFRQTVFIL